ncbi:hypothetical protein B9Z55_013037 [Caenorhabditis nigoni]|nr:hypothetical protein B9Z55_013037 [Caenorhabditis nigoni]
MKQQQASTEHLTHQPSPSLTRSSSLMIGSPRTTVMSPLVPADDDSQNFKCPFLPPMRSHETQKEQKYSHQSTPIPVRKTSKTQISTDPNSSMEFGDFNEIIKNSTEDTNFPIPHQPVEARPSVTALRSSACGLVQSRINHFQTIERSISHRRTSADLSTSGGRPSTTSLKSIDTTTSSSGKL